jgi:hypothetical protein
MPKTAVISHKEQKADHFTKSSEETSLLFGQRELRDEGTRKERTVTGKVEEAEFINGSTPSTWLVAKVKKVPEKKKQEKK